MGMHLTRKPMTTEALDGILASIGWRRDGEEAYDLGDHRRGYIHDIATVPAADGSPHVMIEAKTEAAIRVAAALDCVPEEDPLFWRTLGIDIETGTSH